MFVILMKGARVSFVIIRWSLLQTEPGLVPTFVILFLAFRFPASLSAREGSAEILHAALRPRHRSSQYMTSHIPTLHS